MQSGPASSQIDTSSKEIAQLLAKHRPEAITCFSDPLIPLEKWLGDIQRDGLPAVADCEAGPLVDFLIESFRSADSSWRIMFQGHLQEQLRLDAPPEKLAASYRDEVLHRQKTLLSKMLSNHGARKLALEFEGAFDDLVSPVAASENPCCLINALFVGDCVYEHLVAFLIPMLRKEGIELRYTLATARKMSEMNRYFEKIASERFDLVFFSPYTQLFNVAVQQLIRSGNPLVSRAEISKTARAGHEQTIQMIRALVNYFDCPIAVQTTTNILPESTPFKTFVKRRLSARNRALVSHELNQLLLDFLKGRFEDRAPVVVIDERPIVEQFGEKTLGKHYYDNGKYHPTVLGSKLADVYAPLIIAKAKLTSKKLIALDLDDTLWKGTIGEGGVSHYHERQAPLLELRRKGVLLAVVSKNDPKNLTWEGGILKADDFVAEKINWDPKPLSIKRIAEELNLKTKDFLFVDDQPQQLDMVKSELPEVEVLNAGFPKTWELLATWASILPEQRETDRTQLYKEKKNRESFLETAEPVDETALYLKLGLKLTVGLAPKKEHERVAELINRTNQFNTTAMRTSVAQVKEWSNAPEYRVVVARCGDKFGDMGIISVMILKQSGACLEIISWVLSCRVFGYGIETLMLNYAQQVAEKMALSQLKGKIVKTSHNGPCQDVFANHQFQLADGEWFTDSRNQLPGPSWLATTFNL